MLHSRIFTNVEKGIVITEVFYIGDPAEFAGIMDEFHTTLPDKPTRMYLNGKLMGDSVPHFVNKNGQIPVQPS